MVQSLDLAERTADRIDSNLNLPGSLVMGQPTTHGQSFAYQMRALQKYTDYLDGRQKRTFGFDIQAKCSNWQNANDWLDEIARLLERTRSFQLESNNNSFEFVKATLKQPPSFMAIVTDNLNDVTGKDVSGDGVFCIYKISLEITAIINK